MANLTSWVNTRIAIVQDTDGKWFIRRIAYSVETPQEMVYHCDVPIAGPYDDIEDLYREWYL